MKKYGLNLAVIVASVFAVSMTAQPVSAQIVVTPGTSGIAFNQSADHDAVGGSANEPIVTRYEVDIISENGTGAVIQTVDLGKPTPVSGVIAVQPFNFGPLADGGEYRFRVSAIGPGGAGVSLLNDDGPFGLAPVPPPAPGAPSGGTVLP